MKANKKGFTLIELLAVIIILAIIALIAVPVILNIIADARKSAAADSAYAILDAAELYYAQQLLSNPSESFTGQTFTFTNGTVSPELKIQGSKPTAGTVTLDSTGNATLGAEGLTINGFKCTAAAATGVITCE